MSRPIHSFADLRSKRVLFWIEFLIAVTVPVIASAAVATRHYDFEDGIDGGEPTALTDVVPDALYESDLGGLWPEGHYWIEVPAGVQRPLPPGILVESVLETALEATDLELVEGGASLVDVSNGSLFDSPAVDSNLALRFNGDTSYNDEETGPGSRGVYVHRPSFNEGAELIVGENVAESFSIMSQGWVYPDSGGIEFEQTVWQLGVEQGSVNITADGFWEFRHLGSVGDLNPEIPVEFDAWTHLGIFRGGNGAEIYVNGELVAGDRNPTPANWFNTFANLVTLGGSDEGTNHFYGIVDDFKVMGTADLSVNPELDMDFWKTVQPTDAACDFDQNGACDVTDVDMLLREGQASQTLDPYDLNGDGAVDLSDRDTWLELAGAENGLSLVAGDTNLDGVVAATDLNVLGTNWLRTDATSISQGDFNGDSKVDATDLNEVGVNWQHGAAATITAAAVPEPSSCLALLTSLALLLVACRRQRN